jgi:peptidoglycan/LPS O-acetylase OafA/YrhL
MSSPSVADPNLPRGGPARSVPRSDVVARRRNRAECAAVRHVPALDGLRGAAIALVLLCHFGNAWPGSGVLDAWVREGTGLGWIGVDLFFVLSGFLITGILVDGAPVGRLRARETLRWMGAFLARRALRIFPLYYVALAAFVALGPAAGLVDEWTLRARGWWYAVYLGNWAYPAKQGIPALAHFWSLAVEEQFYLVWPLVVLAARGRRLAAVAAALVVAGPLVRAVIVDSGWPVGSAYRVTPGRVDALAMGALVAVALRNERGRAGLARLAGPATAAGLAGFLLFGAAFRFDMHARAMEVWSHTFLAVGFGGLVAATARADERNWLGRLLAAAPLRFLGRVSYGLYVVHFFVHVAALAALRARPATAALLASRSGYLLYAATGAAVSVGLAVLSWNLLERRFLALKERLGARSNREAPPLAV